MTKNKFKIAIIGAGNMAEEYLKVLSHKKICCEGIFSKTQSKPRKLKKKYKIKKIYKTIDDLKKNREIDALIIAVNEKSLLPILNNLDASKYKILCEKPVGRNLYETNEIISIIKNNQFYVALNRRFHSSNLKASKLVNKSKRLISIRDQQNQNYKSKDVKDYLMYTNSVHLIDYINIYARGILKKIYRVKKFKNQKFSEHLTRLIFSSKDEVLYHCNWNSPGTWSVNIIQKENSIEMKPLENLVQQKIVKGKRINIFHNKSEIDLKFKPGLFYQVSEFLKMLNNKKHKLVNLKNYYKTVKLIKKIYV